MPHSNEEIPLSLPTRRASLSEDERGAVYRRGDVVVRETGPWGKTVHSLLNHREDVGFDGAPRVVGSGFDADGRETLSYIEGEVIDPSPWTVDAAVAVGNLVRRLHDATASYIPPDDAIWPPWWGRELGGSTRIIGHCDITPWNIVSRDGIPTAVVDWEIAGPVNPLVDLAQAAWLNAKLYGDDDDSRLEGLAPFPERVAQLKAIVDAYGLTAKERRGFVDLMIVINVHDTAYQADEANVTRHSTDPEALWGLTWRARSAVWLMRERANLQNAIS